MGGGGVVSDLGAMQIQKSSLSRRQSRPRARSGRRRGRRTFTLGAHRPAARCMDNANTRADVERLAREATARLSELEAAPGVQTGVVPPEALIPEWGGAAPGGKNWNESDDDAAAAADERLGAYGMQHLVVRDPEGRDDRAAFY